MTTTVKTAYHANVELQGHLIDSLTLARVMDLIQSEGCDYQLNHMQIGSVKKEASLVSMTIFATSQTALDQLIVALSAYGASVLGKDSALLGAVSPQVFSLRLPRAVFVNGKRLPITSAVIGSALEQPLVIAVSADQTSARLTGADAVKANEQVVTSQQGIEWA